MSGRYEQPITIREAIQNIDSQIFLLPAIQREFVWSDTQICVLFDSLMRDYPINTMMVWDVSSSEVKNNHRFYRFLDDFCERYKVSGDLVQTRGAFHNFKAVIDGQQRLTAIYIGLKGTYAYKLPRVWWPKVRDDEALPPRKLYLDIKKPISGETGTDQMTEFDFRFLTDKQFKASRLDPNVYFFRVGEILEMKEVKTQDQIAFDIVVPYLTDLGLADNAFARSTLMRLYHLVRFEPVIHYYCEKNQELDHVLDVFIRTNSGGTPLAFSDLLMSIATANWKGDARKDIDGLVISARQDFNISRDWVLKACLVLTEADVRFRVANFGPDQVTLIENQWPELRQCLAEALRLAKGLGLKDGSLRAKNALIPIAYYLYKQKVNGKPLYECINNLSMLRQERILISKWLYTVLLKGTFGGQADGILRRMRRLIRQHLTKGSFPLSEIVAAFAGRNKDLRFDEAYLSGMLDIRYGDARCRSVLGLLFPEINENQLIDIDHLHPSDAFKPASLSQMPFLASAPKRMDYYSDVANWNSIPNLHLLNSSQNRSKQDRTLAEWMATKDCGFSMSDLLLEKEDSLDFEDFEAFCARRRDVLLVRLRANVIMSDGPLDAEAPLDGDDEDDDLESFLELETVV